MLKNDRWVDRANRSIAQGALTNSKLPQSGIRGLYPTHIKGGHGCHIYDTDDTKYVDFICGLGSNLFGYSNDEIVQPILKQIYAGANHSFPTIHEVEAAESLKETMPFVERVKWLKTGTEACMAAIKFARAYTGRNEIISEGYHGWSDEFCGLTPPAKGVPNVPPDQVREINITEITDQTAAVIVEPVITDYSSDRIDRLNEIQKKCEEHGAILIFDEVITGLRWQSGSVGAFYGIRPDLVCVGKAIGGGYSLAGVGGRADILDDPEVFVSSTYAGETIPLIAAKAAMTLLVQKSDYNIDYLWEKGQKFIDEFNALGGVLIHGYPTRGSLTGTINERALFCQEMAKAKILFHPSTWFFNFPLIKVMDDVLSITEAVKRKIAMGNCSLEYKLPESPFSANFRKGIK